MPIACKRIYEDPAPADGHRVLVDRLWPRGVSKDVAEIDLWAKDAAPSTALRREFAHDPEWFGEFSARYRAELQQRASANPELFDAILNPARAEKTVTLLYAAKDPLHNHARVIAEFLRERLAGRHNG